MNILSLFDGMSCGRIAAERAGLKVDKYYASEVDKHAIKVAQANWPDNIQLGDVTKWRDWDIDWSSIDLLIGGSPCQGFSLQGNQIAFNDPRSALFFVYADILNHIRSVNHNVKFMLENVKMKPEFIEVINLHLGVKPVDINSNVFVPQSRGRLYWANFNIAKPEQRHYSASSFLDADRHHMKPATVRKGDPMPVVLTGNCFGCLTYSYYKGIRADGRPAAAIKAGVFDELRLTGDVVMLRPEECERLQGLPTGYTKAADSKTQRYMMIGNGWTVDVIAHIFKSMQ